MKFHLLLPTLIVLIIMAGCSTRITPRAAAVIDADEAMVNRCAFLGNVQGSSGWGNLAASVGMENAKTEAREKAATLGATHIVWGNISGGYSPYVSGRAYLCN